MKLPKTVKVGGFVYDITFPYLFTERNDLCGQVSHEGLEIRIGDSDLAGGIRAESKIISTLIHEVIHSISITWNIDLTEEQVEQLEYGIFTVLFDNWAQAFDVFKNKGEKK